MSSDEGLRSATASAVRGVLGGAAIVAVVALGWWVASLNRVIVDTSLSESTASIVVELPNPAPLIVTISPARRADGTEVLIDARSAAHPPGATAGQLVVALDQLEPGVHQIEIRVRRPTWVAKSVEIEVEVLAGTALP